MDACVQIILPDSFYFPKALPKEKICESSPIELVVNAYGQWTLTQPRDRAELQPPLPIDSPLMLASTMMSGGGTSGLKSEPKVDPFANQDDDEDKWLSQVEILTHVGPHRRLWMGPQFSFKTFQPHDGGDG